MREESAARDLPGYRAPASCADAASWLNAVASRLAPDAQQLGRRELPDLVESLEVSPDGRRALLRLRGAAGERVVNGKDCGEVLAGAALIAALAVGSGAEPKSESEPKPEPETEPETEPASVPEPSRADGAPELPFAPTAIARESADRVDVVAVDGGAREKPAPPAPGTRWAIGAGAGAHTGLAPWPAGVVDGAFELSWPNRGWSARARGSVGLSRALVRQRSARFVFVGGSVDVCPLVLGAHLGWQWRSCIGFELGRVHAEGEAESALRSAETHRIWWAAPGLVTRLQLPRVRGIRLEAEAGASLPLWRQGFEFRDPDVSVFETPAVALTARLGLQVPLE